MKKVELKLYRSGREIITDINMIHDLIKTPNEKLKVRLDFYNYFSKDDRFLLKFTDVNIVSDIPLVFSDIDYSSNRYVDFKLEGGLPNNEYEVSVIVMLDDAQVWEAKLLVTIGYETTGVI